jgi:hypothetical protein
MRAPVAFAAIAMLVLVGCVSPSTRRIYGQNVPKTVEPVTDPDAYALYAVVVPREWARVSKGTVLLQQETETSSPCRSISENRDSEWDGVEKNFKTENAVVRLLQPILPVGTPYRLVPRAQVAADDARLAIKYPGIWLRRPESIEYAAVSAVGFNSMKTKALVYVRLRSSGQYVFMEKLAGHWIDASHGGCGWIA